MSLVVLAKGYLIYRSLDSQIVFWIIETIEELMEVVIPLFSEIENKNVSAPVWSTHPLTDDFLRKQVSIVPIRDSRSLGITFPIPDLVPYYKSQVYMKNSNLYNRLNVLIAKSRVIISHI